MYEKVPILMYEKVPGISIFYDLWLFMIFKCSEYFSEDKRTFMYRDTCFVCKIYSSYATSFFCTDPVLFVVHISCACRGHIIQIICKLQPTTRRQSGHPGAARRSATFTLPRIAGAARFELAPFKSSARACTIFGRDRKTNWCHTHNCANARALKYSVPANAVSTTLP